MKHAVLIGLNHTIGLEPLNAAVESARQMEAWANGQGFVTHLFVDSADKPVKADHIVDKIEEILETPPTQLIIYFSGHGCIKTAGSELWLLSNVLKRGEEAFDLHASKMNAYTSGVKNVIFISDACRSPVEDYKITPANGRSIFPNMNNRDSETKIDMLYASWPGDPAFEIRQPGGGYTAIYSECLLECLNGKVTDVIRAIRQPSPGILAVIPYDLGEYLMKAVPNRISQGLVFFKQQPLAEVNSREPVYISKISDLKSASDSRGKGCDREEHVDYGVEFDEPGEYEFPARREGGNVKTKLDRMLTAIGDDVASDQNRRHSEEIIKNTYGPLYLRNAAIRNYHWMELANQAPSEFRINSQGSFNIFLLNSLRKNLIGARDDPAKRRSMYRYQVVGGDENLRSAEILLAQNSETGTGFPIALIPGFFCQINVERDVLISVDYVPLSPIKFGQWGNEVRSIAERKAAIISAARYGIFQARSEIGTYLRRLKHLDPILGLFAAYAYAQNGDFDDVESVYHYVIRDDGTALFDVEMLRKIAGGTREQSGFFELRNIPLLTQGFSYLPMIYEDDHSRKLSTMLRSGLWTTFQAEGVEYLIEHFNLRTS
jgi:hypothetical protein